LEGGEREIGGRSERDLREERHRRIIIRVECGASGASGVSGSSDASGSPSSSGSLERSLKENMNESPGSEQCFDSTIQLERQSGHRFSESQTNGDSGKKADILSFSGSEKEGSE